MACQFLPDLELARARVLVRTALRHKLFKAATAALGLLIFVFIALQHLKSRYFLAGDPSLLPSPPPPLSSIYPSSFPTQTSPLPPPREYDNAPSASKYCADRFTTSYLEHLRDHAVQYCEPGSRSAFTCFHSHTAPDGRVDSFCIGREVVLDSVGKFALDCPLRSLGPDDEANGAVPVSSLQEYWYDTGPGKIVPNFVNLQANEEVQAAQEQRRQQQQQQQKPGIPEPQNPHDTAPRFYLLLKREGGGNTWHSLMEIWSAMMTMDVLRMSRDPLGGGAPIFRDPEDVADTQVVILDDDADGPYFALWSLIAKRKPVRLRELVEDARASGRGNSGASIIIPLAGASNPAWQNDWEVRDCTNGATLSAFSRRVLDFYGIGDAHSSSADTDAEADAASTIVVTFVDRQSSRRLRNQTALLAALQERRGLHVTVRAIDFAALPFAEQLRVVRETDVLVGVHGAGLTHAMFLREGATAVVEILPPELDHVGFRNLAAMRGLGYFRVHADPPVPGLRRRDSWHWSDVEIGPERFMEVMDAAIKSLYARGLRNYDVI